MYFVQLDETSDDKIYTHVLHQWMNSDLADAGQKSVFIEWFVKDPQITV